MPDTDLEQIERRALRALDAAPPPWLPFLETGGGLGGDSFIRLGEDLDVDQEMYLHVYRGRGGELSGPTGSRRRVRRPRAGRCHTAHRRDQATSRIAGLCILILRRSGGIVVYDRARRRTRPDQQRQSRRRLPNCTLMGLIVTTVMPPAIRPECDRSSRPAGIRAARR